MTPQPPRIIAFAFFLLICNNLLAQDEDYVSKAALSSIFIYASTQKPCEPPSKGITLLPLGTGFVVGIPRDKQTQSEVWKGWKFLITADHVIAGQSSIILRLNTKQNSSFSCFVIPLKQQGNETNVFRKSENVDLVAISLPDIANADPTVFDLSLVADEEQMKTLGVREGTDVFTVGYLYGYSGVKQNFPVVKFGKVSLLSSELWYHSPRNMDERAYVIELPGSPGLSGAPVILQSPQFRINADGKFEFRRMPPYIVGVIKGILASPLGSQGLTAIEPAENLRSLLLTISKSIDASGPNLN